MKKYLFLILLITFWSCEDETETVSEFEYHSNNRVSSLLMTTSAYTNWIDNDGFTNSEKRLPLFKKIYSTFEDKYDFVFLILNEETIPSNISYYGMLIGVSNSVQGIGKSTYDYSSEYGSSGKLKAVMQLTGLEFLKYGPALHELAHQWANFALSTYAVSDTGANITSFPYGSHWGFTGGSTAGQLGGFNQSSLVNNGNNSYTVDGFGFFANGGNGVPYNEFELYLMGMIPASSVSSFDMFTDITSFSVHSSTFNFTGTRTTYDSEAIIELLGERVPSATNALKDFKLLVVVLTNSPLSENEWAKVDATAEWFSKPGDDGTGLYNFWEATNGMGTITIEN